MAPTPMQRKLTAILCADVVGYSGLMEADETGTLERLKANRSRIFDPHVATHRGRVFKLMGDGALVEFASVVAAVNCALAIQEATAQAEQEISEAKRISYRIGINLGEVVVEGDDIYGDGVNVAARLQALAEPGGVALSLTVRDQVAGKVAAEFDDLGEHTVKNIARPVHVFALRAAAARTSSGGDAARAAAAVDLRAAVRQHERRSRAGVFQRRHHRGHHHRSLQGLRPRRRFAQHGLHLQGRSTSTSRRWRAS